MARDAANPYAEGLERTAANYTALSPLGFLERAARVYPGRPAVVHGARRFSWAETYLRWLATLPLDGVAASADAMRDISQTAKAFQFQLARALSRGKDLDLAPIDAMGAQWERGMAPLPARFR